MKYLILLSMCINLIASDYLLLSGFAWHSQSKNNRDREFNKFIYGAGWQHKFDNFSSSILLYNDSNDNFNTTATVGYTYKLNDNISIGAEAGVQYHTVVFECYDEKRFDVVVAPKVEILYDDIMINLVYIPAFRVGEIYSPHVLYINFGLKVL